MSSPQIPPQCPLAVDSAPRESRGELCRPRPRHPGAPVRRVDKTIYATVDSPGNPHCQERRGQPHDLRRPQRGRVDDVPPPKPGSHLRAQSRPPQKRTSPPAHTTRPRHKEHGNSRVPTTRNIRLPEMRERHNEETNVEREPAIGGFACTARHLKKISGRNYSRQAVQGLWARRNKNGFPDFHVFPINDRDCHYLLLSEVTTWYHQKQTRAHG